MLTFRQTVPDFSRVGITGRQELKVIIALWFGDWVDGYTLMANYNSAARTRISNLRARGIEIESRRGRGAMYEYRLTESARERLSALCEGDK